VLNAEEHNVFLKLQAFDESDGLYINTIPLKAESVDFSTDKTIPSFPIPNKTINLRGVITDQTITKKHGSNSKVLNFTAHEIAQMIASGVDSTGLAEHQAFNELVVLMPSIVDKDYNQVASRQIPFTYRSRGGSLSLDNSRVPLPFSFPDSITDDGVKGFIRSFGFTFSGETRFIEFTMDFQVATILP